MSKYELLKLFLNRSDKKKTTPNLKYNDKKLYHYSELIAEYDTKTNEIILYCPRVFSQTTARLYNKLFDLLNLDVLKKGGYYIINGEKAFIEGEPLRIPYFINNCLVMNN